MIILGSRRFIKGPTALRLMRRGGGGGGFSADIGDYVEGGVYAGQLNIGGSDYHIISGLASSERESLQWKTSRTTTPGTTSRVDGLANTLAMEAAGIASHPAGNYCLNYEREGYSDWYMPAEGELALIRANLLGHPEWATNIANAETNFSSSEASVDTAWTWRFEIANPLNNVYKDFSFRWVRPFRRVQV